MRMAQLRLSHAPTPPLKMPAQRAESFSSRELEGPEFLVPLLPVILSAVPHAVRWASPPFARLPNRPVKHVRVASLLVEGLVPHGYLFLRWVKHSRQ
jgi:hypothetical protein